MKTLQQFYVPPSDKKIFVDATVLPAFFDSNLVDPARVVKVFLNDPQANIRVFYYQYLKLCFEIDTVDYDMYIQKIQQLINNDTFKFVFFEEDDPAIFNDIQFKKLITSFFQLLSEGTINVEKALNLYPIMDTVFVYFFRTLMILTGRTDAIDSYIDREEFFDFLPKYFSVEISVHNKCFKYEDADIFVYEENAQEVFMAYMDYDSELQVHEPIQPSIVTGVTNLPVVSARELASPNGSAPAQVNANVQPQRDQDQAQYQGNQMQGYQEKPYLKQPQPYGQPKTEYQRIATTINQSYIQSQFMDYTNPGPKSTIDKLYNADMKRSNVQEDRIGQGESRIEQPRETIKITTEYVAETRYETKIDGATYPSKPTTANIYDYSGFSYTPQSPNSQAQTVNTSLTNAFPTLNPAQFPKNPVPQPPSSQFRGQGSPASPNMYDRKYGVEDYGYKAKQDYGEGNSWQPTKDKSFDRQDYLYGEVAKQSESYKGNNMYGYEYGKAYETYSSSSSKKNPCGLNVSDEFTNSLTMRAMAEPYRSNVQSMRSRARAFRSSLAGLAR